MAMAEPLSLEVSDPVGDAGGLRFANVHSPALRGRGDFCLYQTGEAKGLPIIVLLHGVYGSAWSWPLQGQAHLSLAQAVAQGVIPPCVLVTPSDGLYGLGSAYLPLGHGDYERWIMHDLLAAVRQIVPQANGRLYLGGLSMGGYGALRLGAKYAAQVSGISVHSSVTSLADLQQFLLGEPHDHGCDDTEADILQWARRAGPDLPQLRFDCGTDDPLIAANRALHARLDALGIAHRYEESSGGHEWPYWTTHLAETYAFFGAVERSLRA